MKKTPVSDRAITVDWPIFISAMLGRLQAGKSTYGDRSFSKDPNQLTEELSQECLDISGWGFVLWCRVRAIEKAIKECGNGNQTKSKRKSKSAD